MFGTSRALSLAKKNQRYDRVYADISELRDTNLDYFPVSQLNNISTQINSIIANGFQKDLVDAFQALCKGILYQELEGGDIYMDIESLFIGERLVTEDSLRDIQTRIEAVSSHALKEELRRPFESLCDYAREIAPDAFDAFILGSGPKF